MKLKKNTIINRSFQSKAPDWIGPIYDTVQTALNDILQNKSFAKKLICLKLKHKNKTGKLVDKARGTLWKEIQAIIGNPLQGKINNSAWYNRILMTNIISLIKSHQQQVIIYNLLKANNFVVTPVLRKQLSANNLYPTNVALSNLVKARQMPDLPSHSVLKLNYAFADKQLFAMDDHLKCSIHTMSAKRAKNLNVGGWKDFQIYLPSYIRTRNLIKICKPVFIYSKKVDQIICQVPYQVQAVSHSNFSNILGIDLGKVKLYSGTVLYANNHYSQEFVPSKQLMNLMTKLAKLNDHINSTYTKIKRCKTYTNANLNRQNARHLDYYYTRKKRTRLKAHIEWLMAEEIVDIAIKHHCKEIHLENLTWVNNAGGKWDFSQIATHINYVAELDDIQIKFINPKNTSKRHPVTQQLGRSIKRDIVFDDIKVDRDQLASLNIALCKSNQEIDKLHVRRSVRTRHKSRRRQNYHSKINVLKANKGTQIVVFLRNIAKHVLAFTSLNKNVFDLDNNLAKRNKLKLLKLIDYNSLLS